MGDAWIAGVLDSLAVTEPLHKVTELVQPYRLLVAASRWPLALRRGDRLAALKQDRSASSRDLSTVTRAELVGDACLSESRRGLGDDTECEVEDIGGNSPKRPRVGGA